MRRVAALVHAWVLLDFFGDSRQGSTLTTTIFGQSFFGLVFATLLFPEPPTVPFAAANLSLSTLLVGVGALCLPGRLQRARADNVLTRTAPIHPSLLTLAQLLHRGFHLVLITLGIALPPAILLYWVAGHQLWVVPAYLVVACCCAGLMAGGLSVLVAAASHLLGRLRGALLAGSVKALLFGGGFLAFLFCMRHLGGTLEDLPLPALLVRAWPPYWGARLLHTPLAGWPFALAFVIVALCLLLAWNVLQRRREGPDHVGSGRSWLRGLERRLARRGPLLGLTVFVGTMLYRSPGYRAKVLPLLGLPVAMALLALLDPDPRGGRMLLGVILQLPAVYLPILVAFLPHADQEGAAFLFRTSPRGNEPTLARRAALIALCTRVLLPTHLLGLCVMALSGVGVVPSLSLAAFSLGTAVLVAHACLGRLEDVPFTLEDTAIRLDAGALLGLALGLTLLGGAFAAMTGGVLGPILALAALTAAGMRLLRVRHA